MDSTQGVAEHLLAAHRDRQAFETLRLAGSKLSIPQAYEVQDLFVERLVAEAKTQVVGYKIGLTSQVMQRMCAIDSPVYGQILGSRVHASGNAVPMSRYGRLGVEFEIAVKLARDVPRPPASVDEMASYAEAVCPAIELVDDRRADYSGLDAASLVADNSWNAGIVLGQWAPPPANLPSLEGRLRIDGVQVEQARVGDALDHPLASVRWLASALERRGQQLKAGMVVMTGSIIRTRFPEGAGRWEYEVTGLGSVSLDIL